MIDKIIGAGVFPDVTGANGRFWVIVRDGDPTRPGFVVVSTWEGEQVQQITELVRYPLPAGSPAFPRIYYYGPTGHLWFGYHDGAIGILRNASTGSTSFLAPCQNNDPLCFGARWVAWQGAAADGWPITRMDLQTLERTSAGHGAGTGLSRVDESGRVVLVDEDRNAVPGGTRPSWGGDLVVVEKHGNRGALGRLTNGHEAWIWPDVQIITPRCAYEPTIARYAIAGWSDVLGQLRVAVAEAADFTDPPTPPDPPPTVKPPRFTIVEPRFPLEATIAPGEVVEIPCKIAYTPGSGAADWFAWDRSDRGPGGPWRVDGAFPGTDLDHTVLITAPSVSWIRARGGNAAGTHSTQAERRITVTNQTPDPPDPPDPDTAQPIRTHDELHAWHVRPDGLVDASAAADEEAATPIAIVPQGDKVALYVPSRARYIHAVNGGGGALYADRVDPYAHEQFRKVPISPGFALQADNGQFVSAELGGGGELVANRDDAGPWETFTTHGPVDLGWLRADQGRLRTDAGAWLVPRMYSVFHAPALVRDGNLPELRRLLARAQEASCNGIRVFGQWYYIGGNLAPYAVTDPGWFGWMETVIAEAAAHGQRVALSYFCDAQVLTPSTDERIRLVEGLAGWAKGHPSLIVMTANEARKNGWDEANDPALLDLVRRFKAINSDTLCGASDPLDSGQEGQDNEDYNQAQADIAAAGVDYLLVHPHRTDRYDWVHHLKGASETPDAVNFTGRCWIEEPMGGASQDQPGRRDSSVTAHVAAACVGAMVGAYTYMARQLEDDACPGLVESAPAALIQGSPDYHFINATLGGSPVAAFDTWEKCRTCTNGSHGWAVAYGEHQGTIALAAGWRVVNSWQWADAAGYCELIEVAK